MTNRPPGAAAESAQTSLSLLMRIRQQDNSAWESFVGLYSPLVYSWCRKDVQLNTEDAADVLQDVFKSVFTSVSGFDRESDGSFRAWLRTITSNKLIDRHRKSAGRPTGVGGTGWQQRVSDFSVDSSADFSPMEQGVVLEAAMSVMSDKFKKVNCQAFWMVLLEGHSAADAAAKLGLTEAAVWQACYRIRRRLRVELSDLHGDLFGMPALADPENQ